MAFYGLGASVFAALISLASLALTPLPVGAINLIGLAVNAWIAHTLWWPVVYYYIINGWDDS